MFYGAVVWDPWQIVAQIVCLQCLYYLTLGLFFTVLVGTRVSRLSLFYFFDFAAVTVSTATGYYVIASFILTSLAGRECIIALLMGLLWPIGLSYVFETMVGCFRDHSKFMAAVSEDYASPVAGYLMYLVERAKKCLDFSATVYIVHLFICIAYGGWPSSFTWWIVNVAGLAIMALLGEYLCIRRELQDIPINRYRPNI